MSTNSLRNLTVDEHSRAMDGWYCLQNRSELLIALSRFMLSMVSIVTVWIDQTEPARYTVQLYNLMVGYVFYSLAILLVLFRMRYPARHVALVIIGIDICFITIFMFFSDISNSPFFILIIFSIISATQLWHWRYVLITSVVAMTLFVGIGIYSFFFIHDQNFDLNIFILRCTFIGIITALLCYFGYNHKRILKGMAILLQSPNYNFRDIHDLVHQLLRNTCRIVGASRTLIVWEEAEEPWLNTAIYLADSDRIEFAQEPPNAFGEITAPVLSAYNFFCYYNALPETKVFCEYPNGYRYLYHIEPIDGRMISRFQMQSILCLSLTNQHFSGRLFFLDKKLLSLNDLVIGKIVASHISVNLDQHCFFNKLRQTTVLEERIKLSRNLHDGLLQSLSSLAMKAHMVDHLIDRDIKSARKELVDIQNLIRSEQQDMRCQIHKLNHLHADTSTMNASFTDRLADLIRFISRNWELEIEFDMEAFIQDVSSADISAIEDDIYFILREALVNTAKHTATIKAIVRLRIEENRVLIQVTDRGRGFPFKGCYDLSALRSIQAGPESIKHRVHELGGSLILDSWESGTCLTVQIPMDILDY